MSALDGVGLGDVRDYLGAAVTVTDGGLHLRSGTAAEVFRLLLNTGARDLGLVRAVEPHLDAVSIIQQARREGYPADVRSGCTWGVFAAEAPDGVLRASSDGRQWIVEGTKRWCSLASILDRALVTAVTESSERMLFEIDLHDGGVQVLDSAWPARGLTEIPSGPVCFDRVRASPIGVTGWYLNRAGFHWGGIAVAACWLGGAVGLARDLHAALSPSSREFQLIHLGAVDAALSAALATLFDAADRIDRGAAEGEEGRILAYRVRAVAASTAEEILRRVGHALGPEPLALDPNFAKRVADLTLYVRQHHAERDELSLGSALAMARETPW